MNPPADTISLPADGRFQALRTHAADKSVTSRLETLTLDDLSDGELLVRVQWAGVNYKDSLAVTGGAKIITRFPRVAGIELVGQVARSADARFAPGQEVLVHGFQTGIDFDGGFAEWARVPAAHAMRVPAGLSAREAAILGVPGFTVALALTRFEELGLEPASGPVAVSGAGGAVGMLALAILSRAGYEAVGLSRSLDGAGELKALGASDVVSTADAQASRRPLESARFAAAIDNVGGPVLSWLLRSLKMDGRLAVVGNASGIAFESNVLPFIMRNVRMFGVVANASWPVREALWSRLGSDWRPDFDRLAPHVHELALPQLLDHCQAQVAGRTRGRTLVRF